MERITNVNKLKKGDMIVNVTGETITILEFIEVHPHNETYSLMLNLSTKDAPKFYNKRLEEDIWYRYTNDDDQWAELYQMIVNNLNKTILRYQSKIEVLRSRSRT